MEASFLLPPPFPSLFGACTASNPIYLLSVLWTLAINRGSDSIFFKNKHQTLLPQAQKHSLAGAGWGHCVQAPASGHWGPKGQRGTKKKLGGERGWVELVKPPGATLASSPLGNMAAPLILLGPPSFLPISLHQAASVIPRLTVSKERSYSDTTPQATVECLHPQCRGALGCRER